MLGALRVSATLRLLLVALRLLLVYYKQSPNIIFYYNIDKKEQIHHRRLVAFASLSEASIIHPYNIQYRHMIAARSARFAAPLLCCYHIHTTI